VGQGSVKLDAAVAAGSAQDELKFPTKPKAATKGRGRGKASLVAAERWSWMRHRLVRMSSCANYRTISMSVRRGNVRKPSPFEVNKQGRGKESFWASNGGGGGDNRPFSACSPVVAMVNK